MGRNDWVVGNPRIQILKCDRCHQAYYLPTHSCRQCGSNDLSIHESDGIGSCLAATTIHPKYSLRNTDVFLAMVRLDDGVTILTKRSANIAPGDRVRVVFQDDAIREPTAIKY